MTLDAIDKKILAALQIDSRLSTAALAEKIGLSPAPCWRRVQRLTEAGYILRQVAVLDPRKLNLPVSLFVALKAPHHSADWIATFRKVITTTPEITEAYRLAGEIDYLIKITVPSIDVYDAVYRRLIEKLDFSDVTASISMEEIKNTTALPLDYA
jgi:Lrp/AsnC family transcriptional regulator, cysteine-sensing transcriptional activator